MEILLTSIHVLAAFVLVTVVLLQHGKGADIGAAFGGGSSQTVFGSRGAGNFLTKMTTLFVVLFMGTSISLAYLGTPQSVFDDMEIPEATPAGEAEPNPDATPIGESGEPDPNAIPGFEAAPAPEGTAQDPASDEDGSTSGASPSGAEEPATEAAPSSGAAPSSDPATPPAPGSDESSSEAAAPPVEPSTPPTPGSN